MNNVPTSPRPSPPAERENAIQLQSFWLLPVGAKFLTTWNDFSKKKPFVKISGHEFSRPGGKRKWIMFTPHEPLQPVQMVIPLKEAV